MRRILARHIKGVDSGFTLIEVLVALVVLTIGVLGISQASLAVVKANANNERRTIAISLVQSRLESIKRAAYAGATTASSTENYGTIANYGGYRRVTSVAFNTPATNMKTITVTVSWEQNHHALSASTILAQ